MGRQILYTREIVLSGSKIQHGVGRCKRDETSFVGNIDPQIETAMKDRYRPVRQRTVRSETTKARAGALPPAVYSSQPFCTKVIFHEDSQDHSMT